MIRVHDKIILSDAYSSVILSTAQFLLSIRTQKDREISESNLSSRARRRLHVQMTSMS